MEMSDDAISDLVIIAIVIVLVVRVAAWSKVKSLLARGWPTVQGTVELVNVEMRRVRYVRYYVARLDYSYAVNNEYYSGFLEKVFMRESSAEAFTGSMKGQMVFIRANSAKPERSALLKDDQPGWPR